MDAKTINSTYDLYGLVTHETKLKPAGARWWVGPCPFCGGRDRFTLKNTTEGYRWHCRNCGEGKYHTTIDYIMRRDTCDFKTALNSLGGETIKPIQRQQEPPRPIIALPDSEWQSQAWQKVGEFSDTLIKSKQAQAARDYLTRRGLEYSTWEIHLLGYGMVFDPRVKHYRPAISIPWHDNETITAIKYRFIDDLANLRFFAHGGSTMILFGLNATSLKGAIQTLILVEGEFNSMSIDQIARPLLLGLDTLSFGSDTNTHEDMLRHVVKDYQRVIVWADDPEKSKAIQARLDHPALGLCSPVIDGKKHDANELLKMGILGEFLQETIQITSGPGKSKFGPVTSCYTHSEPMTAS